jgi:hypothetical protein
MRVKLQLVICHDDGQEETVTDVITLNKNSQRIEQYLRQNRSTCKGFCRFIELLSATTTTPNP